ncbi:NADH:flavin oxidoreductase [Janibacter cremeus]|uniref:2,4-dienoyl-CoA reductase-like NADH-dependent reductase (Old Yellow Enzyme family) n=1 Tax=Janibacter cremeus TaxID=1285192 RepID=A0A852VLL6_9MICO|nr:NADH:flavin oxidoreductase [Janibacter cremeus]NYF96976.1 2,4-dienoyl-CoA reductase-like NADH-dependent reductase (Old Yellow Enzyme family) [Janibacter cremeus]
MTSTCDPHDGLDLAHGPSWTNRFALAPLTNTQSNPDGTLSEDEYHWLVARAEGGFGLTMTCATYVAPAGQAWAGQLGISDERHLPGLTRLADGIRASGSVSSVQLHHAGRRADPHVHGGPNVAPWDDPEKNTRALTTAEVQEAVEGFVVAAQRAERAGFDGVEVHGAHGYLLTQFLDGRHNDRTDGYGGSLEGRSRALFEVLRGVREGTRADFQVGVRLTPRGNGVVLEEGVTVAQWVLDSGLVDYVDMSLWDAFARVDDGGSLLIDQFTSVHRGATRLGVAGAIRTAEQARWCMEHGADFVDLGRAAIVHHDFPRRAADDSGFAMAGLPVTRDHLRFERVGEDFIDYLDAGWPDFVA